MATGAAREIHIRGIVQGVGFRPFVHRLAERFSLAGHIANTADGVCIRVRGSKSDLDAFIHALKHEPPPLAVITGMTVQPCKAPVSGSGFEIRPSRGGYRPTTLISPDITVCDDCLAEIMDPADRRHHYPFTNCTNCGPRFTIIAGLPYDRPNPSMAVFPMCPQCQREYETPSDRRFHAQPNACPACGPSLFLVDDHGQPAAGDCLAKAARSLAKGKILALRGLGGFHLCVDAANEAAVLRLRERKHRYAKPLAVMARDITTARRCGRVDEQAQKLLLSRERPIVLVPCRRNSPLAAAVAPGIGEVGIMLPYTPLHFLLLHHADCPDLLVMTSGNLGGEPICTANDDALARLGGIADLFLLHNRDILTRVDDSVARILGGRVRMVRRSRGYAPMPVLLPAAMPELLACGAELKNTFCLTRGNQAFVSQHIGDLTGPRNLVFYEESIDHFSRVFEIEPVLVACDLHPDYLSSVFARRYAADRGLPLVGIQHHHAHAAAVMAEHGLEEALAVVFDGAGLGSDGTVWGGEFLRVTRQGFERLGHLAEFVLPGGDAATREPWRIGSALLHMLGRNRDITALATGFGLAPDMVALVQQMVERGLHCPVTTSCGRLFDGIAALLGLRGRVEFEGQAAMELEGLAWSASGGSGAERYPVVIGESAGMLVADSPAMLDALCSDLNQGRAGSDIALAFHHWLAETAQTLTGRLATATGIDSVVLSGGCMQNRLLVSILENRLADNGLRVYTGEKIPVNDGGIALGQAYIGGYRKDVSGNSHAGD
jgi:hydrogenase maturation protein HypF